MCPSESASGGCTALQALPARHACAVGVQNQDADVARSVSDGEPIHSLSHWPYSLAGYVTAVMAGRARSASAANRSQAFGITGSSGPQSRLSESARAGLIARISNPADSATFKFPMNQHVMVYGKSWSPASLMMALSRCCLSFSLQYDSLKPS